MSSTIHEDEIERARRLPTTAPLALERQLRIEARDLQPGDVVVEPERISFEITDVREQCGFIVAGYAFLDIGGTRLYATSQQITVRRLPAGAH